MYLYNDLEVLQRNMHNVTIPNEIQSAPYLFSGWLEIRSCFKTSDNYRVGIKSFPKTLFLLLLPTPLT